MTQLVAAVDPGALDEVLGDAGLVLVDFWADWCGPCHSMRPILEEFAAEELQILRVVGVDVGEHPALGERFDVQSLPTFIFFANGREVSRLIGSRTKRQLARELHSIAVEPG